MCPAVTQAGEPPSWGGTACAPHGGNGEVDREQKTHRELPVRVLQALAEGSPGVPGSRGQVGGDLKGIPAATEPRLRPEAWRGTGWTGSSGQRGTGWAGSSAQRGTGWAGSSAQGVGVLPWGGWTPEKSPKCQVPALKGRAPRCEAVFLSLCSSPVNPAPQEGKWMRH